MLRLYLHKTERHNQIFGIMVSGPTMPELKRQ
jgi:hypothetical protein